jgi:Mg-chelatase subunit ChlD
MTTKMIPLSSRSRILGILSRWFSFFLALFLASGAFSPRAQAQEEKPESLCVVLALDSSGSMEWNDPEGLRFTSAQLFVALLDNGDQVGLIDFSTGSEPLTDGLVTINGPADKVALIDLLAPTPPEGYTDIKAALEESAVMLAGAEGCGTRNLVLLTDGEPEIESDYPEYEDEALAVAGELGVPVMSIALTRQGESAFLQRLAGATDDPGIVIPAADAEALLDAYLDVLSLLKDRTISGGEGVSAPTDVVLPVDPALVPYIDQASFVVSMSPGVEAALIAPDGTPVSADDPSVSFSQVTSRFAVYTIVEPVGGDWTFRLTGEGRALARAVLRSRLRVSPVAPGPFHPQGRPMHIVASLIEEADDGTPITLIGEATFSAVIRRPDGTREALDLLYDDGTHEDAIASDGDFTGLYVNTDLPGVYAITLNGRKGAIPATGRLRVTVVPFPELTVESPESGLHEVRGEPLTFSVALTGAEPVALDRGDVVAEITGPDGRAVELPLVAADGEMRYTGSYLPPADGEYTIRFALAGAYYKGVAYQAEASRVFSVILVPTVTILDEVVDLGVIEKAEMAKGMTVNLRGSSTSQSPEPLSVTLAGVPGVKLVDVQPAELGPVQETRLVLTLQGEDVEPGDYEATLTFSARDGVDLGRRQIPLRFTVYVPVLTIENGETTFDLGEIRVDQLKGTRRVQLDINSTSFEGEPLMVDSVTGVEGVEAALSVDMVPPGKTTEVDLTLNLPQDLGEGEYRAVVNLSTREWVEVSPSAVTVVWSVAPIPWIEMYGIPVALGAAAFAILLILLGTVIRRWQIKRPWGKLVPVRVPPGEPKDEYSLEQSDRRGQISVGRRRRSRIRLNHFSVEPRHAVIFAEKQKVTDPLTGKSSRKKVCLIRSVSEGIVEVGGVRLKEGQVSYPMQDNTPVRLGDFEFQWREK